MQDRTFFEYNLERVGVGEDQIRRVLHDPVESLRAAHAYRKLRTLKPMQVNATHLVQLMARCIGAQTLLAASSPEVRMALARPLAKKTLRRTIEGLQEGPRAVCLRVLSDPNSDLERAANIIGGLTTLEISGFLDVLVNEARTALVVQRIFTADEFPKLT